MPQINVPSSDNSTKKKSSPKNFNTTICLLRILQKLSKNKANRILSMVQWKANAILKRILKVPNTPLHIYALKLLKSQIPYLGKKWRGNNMHVISAIYMNLRHRLKEDYLTGDFDSDPVEASKKEQELRDLVSSFNARRRKQYFIEAGKTVKAELKLGSSEFENEPIDISEKAESIKPLSTLEFEAEDSFFDSTDDLDYKSENEEAWDEAWP
jgi:hypothetical protein